jgi:archaellin
MKLLILSLFVIVCTNTQAQTIVGVNFDGTAIYAPVGGNFIHIDQVGSNNTTTVTQDGDGHSAVVTAGSGTSPVEYNMFSITQTGGAKTAGIDLRSGMNNTLSTLQEGTGNHNANITNFIGSGNQVSIYQGGAGNHTFNVTNPNSATNNGNVVNATQTGGVGANKQFDLQFNGATGASVTIQQTNPTQPDLGGMNIQCNPCGAGNWSYIRF